MLQKDDGELILFLSAGAGCSLDSSPKKNWVERGGGLPQYICKIAKGVMKSGKSKSSAIAIAISRTKAWAAGGDDVDADTRAKAAKAVAEWNALKAKNKSKKLVKATDELGDYVMLSDIPSFNTSIVREAWEQTESSLRRQSGDPDSYPYRWVRELYTDYIIVEINERGKPRFAKIPYTVSGDDVVFGNPTAVENVWVETDETVTLSLSEEDLELTENEEYLLRDDLRVSASHQEYLRLTEG